MGDHVGLIPNDSQRLVSRSWGEPSKPSNCITHVSVIKRKDAILIFDQRHRAQGLGLVSRLPEAQNTSRVSYHFS